MDVEDIEVIGLQPLQTQLDLPHCIIALPRCDLGGKNDLLPSLAHQLSNALFTLPSPIVVSRVHICDSEVERLAERLKSLIFLVIHHEPASSTETVKPVRPKVRVGIFEEALRDWPTAPPSVVAQPNAAVSRNWRLEMFIALPPEFLSSAYLTRRRGSIIQKRPVQPK